MAMACDIPRYDGNTKVTGKKTKKEETETSKEVVRWHKSCGEHTVDEIGTEQRKMLAISEELYTKQMNPYSTLLNYKHRLNQ